MHSLRRGIRPGPIDNIAGERRSGPRLDVARAPGWEEKLVRVTLDGLCRRLGGAVYYSQYIDGEVLVVTSASGPAAPLVNDRVPFPHVAHISAVGESLLAQLDFRGRMDHLSRYEPLRAHRPDHHRPHSAVRSARRARPPGLPVRPPGILRPRDLRGVPPDHSHPGGMHRAVPAHPPAPATHASRSHPQPALSRNPPRSPARGQLPNQPPTASNRRGKARLEHQQQYRTRTALNRAHGNWRGNPGPWPSKPRVPLAYRAEHRGYRTDLASCGPGMLMTSRKGGQPQHMLAVRVPHVSGPAPPGAGPDTHPWPSHTPEVRKSSYASRTPAAPHPGPHSQRSVSVAISDSPLTAT